MNSQHLGNAAVHLIFGASGARGSAMCRRLAGSGATVALASRPSDRLDELPATYASKELRVNAVAPGRVRTPMTQRIWRNPVRYTLRGSAGSFNWQW